MNRLASETSPYLRQHADNPVDWYPWGDDAFGAARERDVPVLLSIGYSACHWCHVMAHESFEDTDTADAMNRLFVNVKVDREERPDVDAIYMEATQAMTGSGGWPMTVFLTPDGRPFYAGTYFPKRTHHGRPGFVDVLNAVSEAWTSRRDDVLRQADDLADAVRQRVSLSGLGAETTTVGRDVLQSAYATLRQSFDPQWGGFGRAPKFPQASFLDLLFRAHAHNASSETLAMLTTTLDAMASGGIHDHLGGGFSRYSVDERWLVPHFEKMLYDQAQLLRAYVQAFQITREARYRQVAEEIVGYVVRDLRGTKGGFFSAEDADSEGEEGKFYVWTPAEIAAVLDPEGLTEAAIDWWGVTEAGNFEGSNILYRPVRGDLVRPPEIERARHLLFEARAGRERPSLDDKALTEWNAMFISALAQAGAALDHDEWVDDARRAADFLLSELRRADGRWLRSWQDGRANIVAYASDLAWLIDAFTRLAEAAGEARWISEARATADQLLELFWDGTEGGLFTTGADGERLLARAKEYYDGATPSANGVAAVALLRLGALTGDRRYTEHGEGIVRWASRAVAAQPQAFTYMLGAVDLLTSGVTEVAVVGDAPELVAAVHERYAPTAVLAWGERFPSPLWESREPGNAYVCRDYACQSPVQTPDALIDQLASFAVSTAAGEGQATI